LLLRLLIGLDVDFLCQPDDGLEVDILGFGSLFLLGSGENANGQ
jgi:hypothetical protein